MCRPARPRRSRLGEQDWHRKAPAAEKLNCEENGTRTGGASKPPRTTARLPTAGLPAVGSTIPHKEGPSGLSESVEVFHAVPVAIPEVAAQGAPWA